MQINFENYKKELQPLRNLNVIVKLREREGEGVDPGRSLKGHL